MANGSFDLGTHVRLLRTARKLTLTDVASESGVSTSTLSKIENNLLSPTYDTLLKIAQGLGLDISALFAEANSPAPSGRRSVTRHDEGATYSVRNYDYQVLCGDLTGKALVPFIATIKNGEAKAVGPKMAHEGEEFIYVLSGEVQVETEFYEATDLKAGDCIYFDSTMAHRCVANGGEDARVLWVHAGAQAEQLLRSIVLKRDKGRSKRKKVSLKL